MTITVTLKREAKSNRSIVKNTQLYNEVSSGASVLGSVYVRDADVETLGHPEYIQVTLSAASTRKGDTDCNERPI
jgi:hypothetical protein